MILQNRSPACFTDDEAGHEKLIHELMRHHGRSRDQAVRLMNEFPSALRASASCGDDVVDVAGSLVSLEVRNSARSHNARRA